MAAGERGGDGGAGVGLGDLRHLPAGARRLRHRRAGGRPRRAGPGQRCGCRCPGCGKDPPHHVPPTSTVGLLSPCPALTSCPPPGAVLGGQHEPSPLAGARHRHRHLGRPLGESVAPPGAVSRPPPHSSRHCCGVGCPWLQCGTPPPRPPPQDKELFSHPPLHPQIWSPWSPPPKDRSPPSPTLVQGPLVSPSQTWDPPWALTLRASPSSQPPSLVCPPAPLPQHPLAPLGHPCSHIPPSWGTPRPPHPPGSP